MSTPGPVIILSSPCSSASRLAAMLGQHPCCYAVPELALLVAPSIQELLDQLPAVRRHGLLRAIAQLYSGEQTLESIDMARRWIFRRVYLSTDEVYRELCERIAPARLVEASPYAAETGHVQRVLERIQSQYPDAHYLHLIRHPLAQGMCWLRQPTALPELQRLGSSEPDMPQFIPDPQFDWYQRNHSILQALLQVAPEQHRRVRFEDLMAEPHLELAGLCQWLQLEWNPAIADAMLHPEHSVYSGVGPYGAHAGLDPDFLADPHFRAEPQAPLPLEQGLPWRADRRGFMPALISLAQTLGYAEPASSTPG